MDTETLRTVHNHRDYLKLTPESTPYQFVLITPDTLSPTGDDQYATERWLAIIKKIFNIHTQLLRCNLTSANSIKINTGRAVVVIVDPQNELSVNTIVQIANRFEVVVLFHGRSGLTEKLSTNRVLCLRWNGLSFAEKQLHRLDKFGIYPHQIVCVGHVQKKLVVLGELEEFTIDITVYNVGDIIIEPRFCVRFLANDLCGGQEIISGKMLHPGASWSSSLKLKGRSTPLNSLEVPFIILDVHSKPLLCKNNVFIMPLEIFTGDFIGAIQEPLVLNVHGSVEHLATNLVTSFSSNLVHLPPVVFDHKDRFHFFHTMAGKALPIEVKKARTVEEEDGSIVVYSLLDKDWDQYKEEISRKQDQVALGNTKVYIVFLQKNSVSTSDIKIPPSNVFTIPAYLLSPSKEANMTSDAQLYRFVRKMIADKKGKMNADAFTNMLLNATTSERDPPPPALPPTSIAESIKEISQRFNASTSERDPPTPALPPASIAESIKEISQRFINSETETPRSNHQPRTSRLSRGRLDRFINPTASSSETPPPLRPSTGRLRSPFLDGSLNQG